MESIKLKAGVAVMGSLIWDDSKDRRDWRKKWFGAENPESGIRIDLPIRYGRYSAGYKRRCPTMVSSYDCIENGSIGTGLFIPLIVEKLTINDLILAAHDLSDAEGGANGNFLKGGVNKWWCIILCWVNPALDAEVGSSFLNEWKKEYGEADFRRLQSHFKMESEDRAVFNENGEYSYPFPENLKEFDVILITQTQPRKAVNIRDRFLTPSEIASQFFERPQYFLMNKFIGIKTSEDDAILNEISTLGLSSFTSKVKSSGVSQAVVQFSLKLFGK